MKHPLEEIEELLSDNNHEPILDNALQIITDLVEEVKKLEREHSDMATINLVQEVELRMLKQGRIVTEFWPGETELQKENKILREALEIYADENNWGGDLSERRSNNEISIDYWWDHCITDYDDYGHITHSDDGRIARKALEGK